MPAWITSLLREETPLPMPPVASATITLCPRRASARATASPITPAPMTKTSMTASYELAISSSIFSDVYFFLVAKRELCRGAAKVAGGGATISHFTWFRSMERSY